MKLFESYELMVKTLCINFPNQVFTVRICLQLISGCPVRQIFRMWLAKGAAPSGQCTDITTKGRCWLWPLKVNIQKLARNAAFLRVFSQTKYRWNFRKCCTCHQFSRSACFCSSYFTWVKVGQPVDTNKGPKRRKFNRWTLKTSTCRFTALSKVDIWSPPFWV